MNRIFVTGGAGYIGSEFVHQLNKDKYEITVFDNLEYGFKSNIPNDVKLIVGDLRDFRSIQKAMCETKPDIVVHFAAYAFVGESVKEPLKYFNNNVTGGINLLMAMEQVDCKRIIFSSTCATYGIPDKFPITEHTEQNPINPYGESKLMMEQIIKTLSKTKGLKYTIFRYFNACGADIENSLYERHNPEPHIIPNILKSIENNKEFTLFGDDYSTEDGTCVRDYINIKDIAWSHVLAIENDVEGDFNLGTGNGISNLQLIRESEKQTNKNCKIKQCGRRKGDPDKLIANPSKANKILNWYPKYSQISCIINEALQGIKHEH